MSLESGKQNEEIEDLVPLAIYSGCPKFDSCFNQPLITPCHFQFCPSRLSYWNNLRKCLLAKHLVV